MGWLRGNGICVAGCGDRAPPPLWPDPPPPTLAEPIGSPGAKAKAPREAQTPAPREPATDGASASNPAKPTGGADTDGVAAAAAQGETEGGEGGEAGEGLPPADAPEPKP